MRIPNAIRFLLLLVVIVAPQLIGCSNFFVPVCEETSTCAPTLTGISPSSGDSGVTVTLTGSFLTGATAVNFGGAAGTSVTVVSDSEVTAVAPTGSGTVNVTVTNPFGTSNGESFTYGSSSGSSTSSPTLTAISPTSGSSGTTVTLTGTNLTGATAVNFGSSAGTSVTVVSSTEVTAVAPAGSGTVSVTVTTPNGTSNGESFSYGSSSSASDFIYVANGNASDIDGLSLSGSKLYTISNSPYQLGSVPSAMVTTPNGSFLYVANTLGEVYVYSIGSNGALTLGNSDQPLPLSLTTPPTFMAVDRKSNFLFIGSNTVAQMYEYQIDTNTGALSVPAGNAQGYVLLSGVPEQIYVTPDNQYVYVGEASFSGTGAGGIDIFALNSSTGALNNSGHVNAKDTALYADDALVSDSNSKFLFAGETGCSCVRAFTIGSSGVLSEVTGSPFTAATGPSAMAVDPTNTYLYVGNKTSNEILGYQISSSGTLTLLSSSPYLGGVGKGAGTDPVAMALDENNNYLAVAASGGSPDLAIFSFDAATPGKLDYVVDASTGTDPTQPVAMSITK
jgi:6-phosphogluconolactonase